MTEHWLDKRIRQRKPIALPGNVPRISAATMVKLHELKNKLAGTNYSLYEAAQLAKEKNEQFPTT